MTGTLSLQEVQVDGHGLYVIKVLVATLSSVFSANIGFIRDAAAWGSLRSVPCYKDRECASEIRPVEGLPAESVVISNESLEVVNKFCYLV